MHLTNDDLYHFLHKNIRYSFDWANEKYQQGKQINLASVILCALFSFFREYVMRADFSRGAYGFILAAASMGYTLDKYIMLWHLTQSKN